MDPKRLSEVELGFAHFLRGQFDVQTMASYGQWNNEASDKNEGTFSVHTLKDDETIARLAEDYEKGALLDFYFADQLRDVGASGFDIASFLGDMVASFDPAREGKRLAETAAFRARALAARKAHPAYSVWLIDTSAVPLRLVNWKLNAGTIL